jgi:hypothetical protein
MQAKNAWWMIVIGGMVGVMLFAGVAGAAKGGLKACEARPNICTTNLNSCTASLGMCMTNLGTCKTEPAVCLAERGTVFPGDATKEKKLVR